MIRTYLIPLVAIAGVVLAVMTVVKGSKPPPPKPPVAEPPTAPFATFIAGSALVEASTQNIAIGTPVPGVAAEVKVIVGQNVQGGDVLFRLDARELQAELAAREASKKVAEAQLAKLRLGTRPEELPPVRARVAEAEAAAADARSQLTMWEAVKDTRAVSEDDLARKRFAALAADARLAQMRADLAMLEAGSWSADIAVAEAQLASAAAQADAARIEIDRRSIKAPVAGRVLQVNLRPGEFAQAGPLQTPLLVMGSVDPMHVRVDVDEHDAWRVKAGAAARAFVRGNKDIWSDLTFVRFEPYVIPKRSLTGESTERVDTRVLQVIYSINRRDLPIYVGQQMDIYIQAPGEPAPRPNPPVPETASSPSAR